jgi:peroxiredoxin Q/BCP
MAQLHQDFEQFTQKNTIILVVGPEDAAAFQNYWAEHHLPFMGLPDPQQKVLKLYGQQIKLLKWGRMPAQLLIDKKGIVRFVYYGDSMSDIPSNSEMLDLIDRMNAE